VAQFPAHAAAITAHPAAFVSLAAVGLVTSFSSTLMFTAAGSFYNRVSDPDMGGAYLTMLNTIANIGITLPKIVVFGLMDALSYNACECATSKHSCHPFVQAGRLRISAELLLVERLKT
jgi:MFS transporter, PAT family, solute carrier family 33 (acetyl-CoA transportor), member 1